MTALLFLFLLSCCRACAHQQDPLTQEQADALVKLINTQLQPLGQKGNLTFSLTSDGQLRADPVLTKDGKDKFLESLGNEEIWKHDSPHFCKPALDCYRLKVKDLSVHAKRHSDKPLVNYYLVHVDPSYSGWDNIRRSVRHISTVVKHKFLGGENNYQKMWAKLQRESLHKQQGITSFRRR